MLCGAGDPRREVQVRSTTTELADPHTVSARGRTGADQRPLAHTEDWRSATYVARIASSHACGVMFRAAGRPSASAPRAGRGLPSSTRCRCSTLPIEVPFTAVSQAMAELQASARQQELARSVDRGKALAQARSPSGDGRARRPARPHARLRAAGRAGRRRRARAGGRGHRAASASTRRRSRRRWPAPRRAEVELADGTVASVFRVGALAEGDAALLCLRALVDLVGPRARGARPDRALPDRGAGAPRTPCTRSSRASPASCWRCSTTPARRGHELPGRLRSFGIDAGGPLAVLSIAFADERADRARALRRLLARVLVRRGVPARRAAGHRRRGRDRRLDRASDLEVGRAARLVEARRRASGRSGARCVGIGRHRRPASASCGAACWRRARRGGSRSGAGADRRWRPFDHVGSHRMLLALHEEHTLRTSRRRCSGRCASTTATHRTALEHDAAHVPRPRRPLRRQSAAALHVHVNTLRNRLERIEELTGRDLSATDDRVDFYLALDARVEQTRQRLTLEIGRTLHWSAARDRWCRVAPCRHSLERIEVPGARGARRCASPLGRALARRSTSRAARSATCSRSEPTTPPST